MVKIAGRLIASTITTISIIGFLLDIEQYDKWNCAYFWVAGLTIFSFALSVGYIAYDEITNMPLRLTNGVASGTKSTRNFLFEWIKDSQNVKILLNDLSWVEDEQMIEMLLAKKEKLTIITAKECKQQARFVAAGIKIIRLNKKGENYVPKSRFTLIGADTSFSKVAVARVMPNDVVLVKKYNSDTNEHRLASDLMALTEQLGEVVK